jgi:hypothetical protein
MAKTFIGELILKLKDEMSGAAKTAATNLDTSVGRIEAAAKRMNSTTWGGQFEERLRKLGASSIDVDKLRTSWEKLNESFASRDVSKSMQALEKSNFKTASLSYFAEMATKVDTAEKSLSKFHSTWKSAATDMAVYGGIGTLMYGGLNALREGVKANAEYQRELSRQDNASISASDQMRIGAEADRLTTRYPSVGFTEALEMARQARGMMGDTERGLAILPDLVKALVALQTAKGTDAAPEELGRLLRGIDNAGKNSAGDLGIKNTRDIIAGLVRATQVEGRELNVGDMWAFMRRAKIAGPGLSTEFLANVAPALVQDMTAPTAGTALSSAFQAFVIGSNAVMNKDNIAEQMRLGLRGKDGLKGANLFGTNPYEWVKQVLLPALQQDGVDVNNDTALAQSIAKLSKNTNATAMLTKMLQQRQQYDRLIEQYRTAVGPEAADTAAAKDPFVAWKGFTSSWAELAASLKGMPEAVAGLNVLTAGIQKFATALRSDSGGAQALMAGAGAASLFGAWKMGQGIWNLSTAGTSLQEAALELKGAAAVMRGDKPGTGPGASNSGQPFGSLGMLGTMLNFLGSALDMPTTKEEWDKNRAAVAARDASANKYLEDSGLAPSSWGGRHGDIYRHATDYMQSRQAMEQSMLPRNGNTPGLSVYFDQSVNEAQQAGQQIQDALSVQATPNVNLAQLQAAVALANQLKSILAGIGGAVAAAKGSVSREMNRNFADHGVTP